MRQIISALQKKLLEVLVYDPKSGLFVWLKAVGRRVKIGAVAGGLDKKGYVRIRFDGKKHRAHRLAYDDAFRTLWAFEGYLLKEILHTHAHPPVDNPPTAGT